MAGLKPRLVKVGNIESNINTTHECMHGCIGMLS